MERKWDKLLWFYIVCKNNAFKDIFEASILYLKKQNLHIIIIFKKVKKEKIILLRVLWGNSTEVKTTSILALTKKLKK